MAAHRERFQKGRRRRTVLPADKAASSFRISMRNWRLRLTSPTAAAYALIAYQTAYLKAHYPLEFLAALLTSELGSHRQHVKFGGRMPDSSHPGAAAGHMPASRNSWWLRGPIRFGRWRSKMSARRHRRSCSDAARGTAVRIALYFCERCDLRKVTTVIESLIKCGAFESRAPGVRR